jgi:hypothetical protein
MILIFVVVGLAVFFAGEFLMKAHYERQVQGMTDEQLRAALPHAQKYGCQMGVIYDELHRREEARDMLERAA